MRDTNATNMRQTRNTAEYDSDEVSVVIDGEYFYLTHNDSGWWVGSNGAFEHFHSGRVAAGHFRQLVDVAMLEQEARRRWSQSFEQWLIGRELYDSGAGEDECSTPGQLRGWREQKEYRERCWQQAYRFEVDGECEAAYVPVAVEPCEMLPV